MSKCATLIALALLACAAVPAEKPVEKPDLVAVLRTSDPESTRWYREAYPALRSVGWRIQVYRVPAIPQLSRTPGPLFSCKGETWEGYRDTASHYERLAEAWGR